MRLRCFELYFWSQKLDLKPYGNRLPICSGGPNGSNFWKINVFLFVFYVSLQFKNLFYKILKLLYIF